jgi:hypothetical protein
MEEVHMQLSGRLDCTGNLGASVVGFDETTNTITIPEQGFVKMLDDGTGFRVVIKPGTGDLLTVKINGRSADVVTDGRALEVDYAVTQNSSTIFDYGVASRGAVSMLGNAKILGVPATRGTLLSTSMAGTPLTMQSNAAISGDVWFANPNGSYSLQSNATIAGSSNPAVIATHVHKGIQAPEFPTIDTSMFAPYATNMLSVPGKKYDSGTLKNIRIKAATNPQFDSDLIIQGIVYIEQPNVVTFNSNVQIKGVVVVDNNIAGTSSTNTIRFDSNVTITGVDGMPNSAEFAALRNLKGSTILAPNFTLHLNSNFGASGGSMLAGKINMDSNASGTIKGSVIALEDKPMAMNSNATITIDGAVPTEVPAGVYFGHHYSPKGDSYREVKADPQTALPGGGGTIDPITGVPIG